jgi:methylmalonyl-CoA mutase N-terminal domain/subunit
VGGATAIEAMTDQIEKEARAEIETIDAMGGAVAAIERGYQSRRIEESAYATQKEIERGERIIVGMNRFGDPEDMARPTFRLDPALEAAQSARVRAFKMKRDAALAAAAAARIEETARREGNLMPAVIDAVKAGVTLGEVSDALRRVYRTYDPAR